MEIKRIYEDSEIIVCVKPQGVTSEDGKQIGMPTLLSESLEKPLVVHRLDREVGGVMVFAKNKNSAANLSSQINSGEFKKEYLAVLEGEVDLKGTLEDLLFHDRNRNKTYVVKSERKGVKSAKLEFQRLGVSEVQGVKVSLVKVKLFTGRTHQIRVQFASRKHPIVGDRKYGSQLKTGFGLWSFCLGIKSLIKPEDLKFSEFPPSVEPWDEFSCDFLPSNR